MRIKNPFGDYELNRRSLFQVLGAGSLLAAQTGQSATDTARSKAKMAMARHRNLFNGDSCVYFYNPELWQPEGGPYSAKAIHRYIGVLADSGIDTFLINPNAQVAWYPSKKLQTIIDGYKRGDRQFFIGHAVAVGVTPDKMEDFLNRQVKFFNLYLDLVEQGVDWLAETSKACRTRGVSPWVTCRMNDMHGAANPTGSHFNCALFKQAKFRLSGRAMDPNDSPHISWMGLNYEHREVRDFMLANIREWMEDYDFDGLELDWLRQPLCCEPVASQKQIDLMTDWMREVRALTEARARRIGKPVPLGLRVPPNLGYMKCIGVDVKAQVAAGLVDFVGFSDIWQTTWSVPYDELRKELGSDVVFYGVVEDAPSWVRGFAPSFAERLQHPSDAVQWNPSLRYMAASAPMQWANAAGKLAMGVHGIEQFNFFCTDQLRMPGLRCDYAALKGTADLASLRGKPKHYCFSTPSTWMTKVAELPEQLPAELRPQWRKEFRLSMCAEPPGRGLQLVAQLVIENHPNPPRLGVSFNENWPVFDRVETRNLLFPNGPITQHTSDHLALDYTLDASQIKDGWNTLLVNNNAKEGDANTVTIVSVELGVKQT